MTDRDRNFWVWLAVIAGFGFAVRLTFLILFDNLYSHEAESYSKINLVNTWIDAGKPYPDINFGPLHTWIIYLMTLFFQNPVLPVRILSLLCGTIALVPYALTVKLMFDNKTALGAAALLAALPVHIRGSATSLALAPFILFICSGLYFYFRYRKQRSVKFSWLVFSALFFNLAGMLRFEAWLFLPLLSLFLVRKNFWHAVAFGAMNLVFPLVHMGVCFRQSGNPFMFATTSSTSFLQYMPLMPLSYKLTGWFVSFGISMTVAVAVLSLFGLLYALFVKKGFHFAMLLFFNFSIFQYKTLTNTIDPSLTRYTTSMALMMLPFASMILWSFAERFGKKSGRGVIIGIVLFAILAGQQLFFASTQAANEALPKDVKQTVEFIRQNSGPDDFIMADSRFHPYVMVESGLPNKQFVSLEFTPDRLHLKEDRLQHLIETTPPTFVILDYSLFEVDQVNSNLDAFSVKKSAKDAVSKGLHFSRQAQFGDFVIFKTQPVSGIQE